MKTAPVVAATLAFDAEGVPISHAYQDRYHPRAGALAQAAHVFLQGNGLPARWRGRERFVVLETGFGLGNNFLATWAAWRADPARSARLHYVAFEKHPLTRDDLARAHAASPLPALVAELRESWPPLTPNLHRLAFDDGRVQLLLALGDIAEWLPEILASVDAFYLDGFAPDRNPAMWQPRVMKALGRLAADSATVATWSAARAVRAGLAAAGFEVRSAPGFAEKRELTLARYAPRFTPRRSPSRLGAPTDPSQHHALIVGAGLAGCATAWALAAEGWSSTLFESLPGIASAASGNRAGIFHGVVHPQDGAHARFNRAAALQARQVVQFALERHGVAGQLGGVLRLEFEVTRDTMQRSLHALGLPLDYVQALSAAEASQRSDLPATAPAWFYPGGGWVDPAGLARSLLRRAGGATALQTVSTVAALRRQGTTWQVLAADGRVLGEAAVVVLANGIDAVHLLGSAELPLHRVRGQTTELVATTRGLRLPSLPITGNGYVLPVLPGGMALCGASSDRNDGDPALRAGDHRHNLARLERLTGSAPLPDLAMLSGRVGWRCVADDRLPLIGAVARSVIDLEPGMRLDQPRFVPRTPGLFAFTALASRGITWAALGAQALASLIGGAPCPLEASLLDAVDVARFTSREARRR